MSEQKTIEVEELMSKATALYMRSVARVEAEMQKDSPNMYTLFSCKGEMYAIEDVLRELYVPGMVTLSELKPKCLLDYLYGSVDNGGSQNG